MFVLISFGRKVAKYSFIVPIRNPFVQTTMRCSSIPYRFCCTIPMLFFPKTELCFDGGKRFRLWCKKDDDGFVIVEVWFERKKWNQTAHAVILEREDTFAWTWPKLTAQIIFMLCQVAIVLIKRCVFFPARWPLFSLELFTPTLFTMWSYITNRRTVYRRRSSTNWLPIKWTRTFP